MQMKKLTGILMLLLCILFCKAQLTYAADDKPGEFEITSPDSGDTFDAGDNITLKWTSSSGCDYYVVNV